MVWPFGPSASFHATVSGKRAQRDAAIEAEAAAHQADGHLTAEEVAIVSKSGKPLSQLLGGQPVQRTIVMVLGVEIVKSIRDREFTSTQILRAFIKSAVIAHGKTNCITEGKGIRTILVTRADFLELS